MTTSSISSKQNGSPPSQHITASTYAPVTSSQVQNPSNRLQFNRLAAERKTVHVMNANLKNVSKNDRQILASYNNNSGTGVGSTNGAAATTNLTNVQNYQNNYLNNSVANDYNGMLTSGRSQTNATTFLQKLSSKFTRR